jgi:hypothetical protein
MEQEEYSGWLKEILSIHFDPKKGSPYWLERACQLGIDPARDVHSLQDLKFFGPMEEEAMKERPIEDFVPRCYRAEKRRWVVGETGGTTGRPMTTVYMEDEFHLAFVHPFERVAQYRNFPRGENWLWVGPSGPHLIGKAAIACARALGSPDPFSVDFDPRWAKRLAPDSIGFKRYLDHVIEQAMQIIVTQDVKVLFTTPRVLRRLKDTMSKKDREAIRGIHFGGMELEKDLFQAIAEAFPMAVFISGYGNTLFGMCPEFTGDPASPLDYYPMGRRLVFQTVPLIPGMTPEEKLKQPCKAGEVGQVVFSRFDRSFLIINLFERDQGEGVFPTEVSRRMDCNGQGLRNPHPLKIKGRESDVATGLY